jgi:hypothetical protein
VLQVAWVSAALVRSAQSCSVQRRLVLSTVVRFYLDLAADGLVPLCCGSFCGFCGLGALVVGGDQGGVIVTSAHPKPLMHLGCISCAFFLDE